MARKEKKYHFIYKTTNLLSGRYYIGMHSTDDLNDGYLGSGKRLRYSINKYGVDNHHREILEFCDTRTDLKAREGEIVNLNEIAKVDCMNLKIGGCGGLDGLSKESLANIRKGASEKLKEMWEDPEYRKKISDISSKRMVQNHINGKIKYDNFTGKKHSDETKQLMSEIKKGTGKGEKNSQYGTCWITKDGSNKKVKKNDLSQYQLEGWERGRK